MDIKQATADSGALRRPAEALSRKRSAGSKKGRAVTVLKYIGPAFVVSVAYMDPGNFATNISGGSRFGYELIWVVMWSNVMAIFLQIMSAKLGIATGRSLPEMCGLVFSRPANIFFLIIAELGAMATNLAEFIGAALGLYLLFRIPMLFSGLLAAALSFAVCSLEKYGQRLVESAITAFVAVIGAAYLIEIFLAGPDWAQVGIHALLPSLPGKEALLIASGMLGATVMPHVIYLHSQLVQHRRVDSSEAGKERHLKLEKLDIIVAMNTAFVINAAMIIVSSAVFFKNGLAVDSIEQAHMSLQPLLGRLSAAAFGVALLASGLSSSAVGTMAGQSVMKGFIDIKIPEGVMRLVTMLPAVSVIILGLNPMRVLLLSQVILSFILPVPVIQMLHIAGKTEYMGSFANKPWVRAAGAIIASVIIALNALLLLSTFGAIGS
jgi:manganese transport protein